MGKGLRQGQEKDLCRRRIPLLLPSPPAEILTVIFSFPFSPNQWAENVANRSLWRKRGGKKGRKKWSTDVRGGREGAEREASSSRMRTGMLVRRRTSDAKLLFKYSTYSNYEIQYKNRDIY